MFELERAAENSGTARHHSIVRSSRPTGHTETGEQKIENQNRGIEGVPPLLFTLRYVIDFFAKSAA